ncbi:hypothetical protein [Cognatilysobacter segetis]|uniref:hypothetical protein n=1 Tax=Cognatilysobacter segetis TaxID=2492394 RepID=UPI00105B850E|nr:hypothetical protein [Lysobacter segetis]
MPTGTGARTVALDPVTRRACLSSAQFCPKQRAGMHSTHRAGSLEVLVVDRRLLTRRTASGR